MMNQIFHQYIEKFIIVYIDNTIIYSNTFKEYMEHLQIILEVLSNNSLFIKLTKCMITVKSIEFLGHVIDKNGVRTDLKKVTAVAEYSALTNVTDLRAFLGLASYY